MGYAFYPRRKHKQVDFCGFEASLAYIVSSKTANATERPCLKQNKMLSING